MDPERHERLSDSAFGSEQFTNDEWNTVLIAEAEFVACTFRGVTFAESVLEGCRFLDCTFTGCDLQLTRVVGSEIAGCTFEDCRLTGIDWTRARWPRHRLHEPNRFVRSDLSMSEFSALHLPGLAVVDGKLVDAIFRETRLPDASFDGTDCTGADFTGADLSGAHLVGARGLSVDARTTKLQGAVLDAAGARQVLDTLGITVE